VRLLRLPTEPITAAMAEIDTDRLLWIVTGVQLHAELGDRPLAYRVQEEVKRILRPLLDGAPEGEPPRLSPAVVSDVFYLNNESLHARPAISIGGPGVNALSALLVSELPTAAAIEDTLVVQMDLDGKDHRCAVWGMNHLDTVRAVEVFISKGYLEAFVRAAAERVNEETG
jgi:hypothetical protein